MQLAGSLDLIDLIRLGFELCGLYPLHDIGASARCVPLTNRDRLTRLLEKLSIHGAGKARRAVKYVQDNSGSPMETALTLLLSLPPMLGGYGFPFPVLNHPIKGTSRLCDLCWPESGLALEYDSDAFHASAQKLNADSMRRMELEDADLRVLSVTRVQVYDPEEFDRLARVVARYLGFRIRTQANANRLRWGLRQRLL